MADSKGIAEYVDGKLLSRILQQWIEEYHKERPVINVRVDQKGFFSPYVGPINYINQETGIHIRIIRKLIVVESELVTLSLADRILTPLGLAYKLSNGELPVIKNPKWSTEKWFEYMKERGCTYDG